MFHRKCPHSKAITIAVFLETSAKSNVIFIFKIRNLFLQEPLGESVSDLYAYHKANHIGQENFERLDALAYKLGNGMLKLVESLERKRNDNDWTDTLVFNESNEVYYAD